MNYVERIGRAFMSDDDRDWSGWHEIDGGY